MILSGLFAERDIAFVQLGKLLRTSSFRLTVLYAGLFSISVLVLLSIMLWTGPRYLGHQLDTRVSDELTDLLSDAGKGRLESLRSLVGRRTQNAAPGVYYLLEDLHGHVLAGNMPWLDPLPGVQSWQHEHTELPINRDFQDVRGRGALIDGKAYLFVGVADIPIDRWHKAILLSFAWIAGATILLAVGGGAVMAVGLLRRVDGIGESIETIMTGDFSRRLPVRGAEDEFDRLAAGVNEMLDRIESLMTGLRQVSNDIAHDLRTPLGRLRHRLWMAERCDPLDPSRTDAIAQSVVEADGILQTFNAILRLAQIESGARTADFRLVDFSTLLLELTETYRVVAEDQGKKISADIASGLELFGDPEMLNQMAANLLDNAVLHTAAGTQIVVTAKPGGGGIAVTIADNGPGIPEIMRGRVFQRFVRLERSRSIPGTGLGLSLVAAIAGVHGARISLENNNPGLLVRLWFPSASASNQSSETTVEAQSHDAIRVRRDVFRRFMGIRKESPEPASGSFLNRVRVSRS